MDDYFRIVITGLSGVGKSWLANRLFQQFKYNKDYQYEDLEQEQQYFQESSEVQQKENTSKNNNYTYKSIIIDNLNIEIIETYGIGSFTDITINQQIQQFLSSYARVDCFIYVHASDYQLDGQTMGYFKSISKLCTPQRLVVYLSRDYCYKKENSDEYNPQWTQVMQQWNYQCNEKKLYKGLHTNVRLLANYLIEQKKQDQNRNINILVYSQQFLKHKKQMAEQKNFNLFDYQREKDHQELFDLAILDFQILFKKWQQNNIDALFNDEIFYKKCAVLIEEEQMKDFTILYKKFNKINYMKSIISQETIQFLSKNSQKITKEDFLKYGLF